MKNKKIKTKVEKWDGKIGEKKEKNKNKDVTSRQNGVSKGA